MVWIEAYLTSWRIGFVWIGYIFKLSINIMVCGSFDIVLKIQDNGTRLPLDSLSLLTEKDRQTVALGG